MFFPDILNSISPHITLQHIVAKLNVIVIPFLQKTPAARVEGRGHSDESGEVRPLGRLNRETKKLLKRKEEEICPYFPILGGTCVLNRHRLNKVTLY